MAVLRFFSNKTYSKMKDLLVVLIISLISLGFVVGPLDEMGQPNVAAENIMKTVENSTVRIGKKSFEIDAVSGHVTHMDLTLKDTVAYQIYLSFYEKTDDGQYVEIPGSEMNADRDDFTLGVKKGLPVNASAATIKATVNAVMTGMIAGTPTQTWGAYNAVMTGYGAPLLPLAQQ
jgi:hypothetical protein